MLLGVDNQKATTTQFLETLLDMRGSVCIELEQGLDVLRCCSAVRKLAFEEGLEAIEPNFLHEIHGLHEANKKLSMIDACQSNH